MSQTGQLVATEPTTDHRSDQRGTKDTWIYFHQITDPPPLRISIGKTSQRRRKRLQQHANSRLGIDVSIAELCEVKGKSSDESFLHNYFSDLRFNGAKEVFEPDERLVDYIRWLRNQYYVAVPNLTDAEWEALDTMDSSLWIPNESRRTPPPPGILPGLYGPLCLPDREVTGDDFYTDERITTAARKAMHGIDIDPASHAVANMKIKATTIFTVADDGLTRSWHGRVWLNPPFGQWGEWSEKLIAEIRKGNTTTACVLATTRTLTAQYFAPLITGCRAMCVLFGRVKFWGPKATDPNDGHVILYFGDDEQRFRNEFKNLGTTFFSSR